MKFTSAFSLLAYAIKVGETQATCGPCVPLPPASKSFQTLRIYNITDPNWTAEQAMEVSAKTTALTLAKMPGFQRYTAAATGDSGLVLYMNQFASEEEAQAAQDAAVDSANHIHNDNDGKLELFISTVTEGYAAFPQDGCFAESQVGKTLTTGLYTYQDPASVDIAEQVTLEQDWYNELYSQTPGFIMSYVSANVPVGDKKSVWKILDSEADEAAYQALKAEKGYEWTGPANDKVITTIGTIGIDVLCSGEHLTDATDVSVPPPAPATTATAKASKASSAKSSKTADAKAEKTSSAKAVKEGSVSVKATKEPKAKKTSPPKTAKATKAFSTSSKATKASPTPSAKATKAADAKADKASSAKASKAKSSTKGGKAGSMPHAVIKSPSS